MIHFERSSVIPPGAEAIFDLELEIDIDAHLGSMTEPGERAIDRVTSGIIGLGETVTGRARHLGVTWTMTTLISEMDSPPPFRRPSTSRTVQGVRPRASVRARGVWHPRDRPREIHCSTGSTRLDRRALGVEPLHAETHCRPQRVHDGPRQPNGVSEHLMSIPRRVDPISSSR